MSFFDGSQVDETVLDSLGSVPPGRYLCLLKACEAKPSKNDPNVFYYAMEFEVADGPLKSRKVYANNIFKHPNSEKSVELGMARMKQAVVAIAGRPTIHSPAEIVGGLCQVTLESRKDKAGKEYSEVTKYENRSVAQGLTAAPTQGKAPF
jgi:hypothetical protein